MARLPQGDPLDDLEQAVDLRGLPIPRLVCDHVSGFQGDMRGGDSVAIRQSHSTMLTIFSSPLQLSLLVYIYPGKSQTLLLCHGLSNTLSFPGLSGDSPGPCFRPVISIAYRHDCPPPPCRPEVPSCQPPPPPPAKSGLQMCAVCFVVLTFLKFTANI